MFPYSLFFDGGGEMFMTVQKTIYVYCLLLVSLSHYYFFQVNLLHRFRSAARHYEKLKKKRASSHPLIVSGFLHNRDIKKQT